MEGKHSQQNPNSVGIQFGSFPPHGRTPGYSSSQPYTTILEAFLGNSSNGAMNGFYDGCLKYRDFVETAAVPWLARGPWATSPSVSSRVKSSNWLAVYNSAGSTPNYLTYATELVNLHSFNPTGNRIALWYQWHQFIFDQDIPAYTPSDPGFDSALGVAQSPIGGAFVQPYTNPLPWDTSLTVGPYAFTGFSAYGTNYGSISAYCAKDQQGSLLTGGPFAPQHTWAYLDYSRQSTRDLQRDLLRTARSGTANSPTGFYLDAFSGEPGRNFDPALGSPGNDGSWEQGKRAALSQWTNYFRQYIDSDFFFSVEEAEETFVDSADLGYIRDVGTGGNLLGAGCFSTAVVYSNYLRMGNLALQYVTPDYATAIVMAQMSTAMWHECGMICYNNTSDMVSISATPQSDPFFNYFATMKILDSSMAYCRPFFEGRRMRNLSTSHQAAYLASNVIPSLNSFSDYYSTHCVPVMSSVWKRNNSSEIGIVISAWLPTSNVPCPAPPACPCPAPPWTFTISIPNLGDIGVANPTGTHSVFAHDLLNPGGVFVGNITGPSIGPVTLTFSQPGVLLIRIV